jgi:hypothetical protein
MAAIRFDTLRNVNQETIIKFTGAASDSGTITIANLGCSTQARNSATPTVNMIRIMASGITNSNLSITRNGIAVFQGSPGAAIDFDLTTNGFSDTVYNTFDLVFTIGTAPVTGYITLRKIAGWDTKVEDATYGAYDDTARVGASTTLSGSPDKV